MLPNEGRKHRSSLKLKLKCITVLEQEAMEKKNKMELEDANKQWP